MASILRHLASVLLAVLFLAGPLAGCTPDAPSLDYASLRSDWEAWRTERDSLYASDDSPVLDEWRDDFLGLSYFEYDSTLAISAALQPALEPDTLYLGTSTGELRPMAASGVLAFRADGRPHRLTAYLPLSPLSEGEAPSLFVPFRDQTTGVETYGGGRYLDLKTGEGGTVILDFNHAYHPTCVVNPSFSCPIPPPQNSLELAVTAGERYPE